MILRNGTVFEKDGTFSKRDVYTDGSVILDQQQDKDDTVYDAEGLYVIPGLVDIHIHGAVGADCCDADPESLRKIASYLLTQGVTSFCPTSMTYPEEKLAEIFANVLAAADSCWKMPSRVSRIAGINMEGPFISKNKAGAQNPAYITNPDIGMFNRLQEACNHMIRLITVAPELPGAQDFIRSLSRNREEAFDNCSGSRRGSNSHAGGQGAEAGCLSISVGHSDCDYNSAVEAFASGADHVTHLYNAMKPYHHREPGIPGAAADYPMTESSQNPAAYKAHPVYAEIICDGIHLHPSVVRNTFRMMGRDRVIIISDSMRACGLPDGVSELGGQTVFKKGPQARLDDGTLAGSVTCLADGFRNAVRFGIPLADALTACTINPAKSIHRDQEIGIITPGARADLILMDKNLEFVRICPSQSPQCRAL